MWAGKTRELSKKLEQVGCRNNRINSEKQWRQVPGGQWSSRPDSSPDPNTDWKETSGLQENCPWKEESPCMWQYPASVRRAYSNDAMKADHLSKSKKAIRSQAGLGVCDWKYTKNEYGIVTECKSCGQELFTDFVLFTGVTKNRVNKKELFTDFRIYASSVDEARMSYLWLTKHILNAKPDNGKRKRGRYGTQYSYLTRWLRLIIPLIIWKEIPF